MAYNPQYPTGSKGIINNKVTGKNFYKSLAEKIDNKKNEE